MFIIKLYLFFLYLNITIFYKSNSSIILKKTVLKVGVVSCLALLLILPWACQGLVVDHPCAKANEAREASLKASIAAALDVVEAQQELEDARKNGAGSAVIMALEKKVNDLQDTEKALTDEFKLLDSILEDCKQKNGGCCGQ